MHIFCSSPKIIVHIHRPNSNCLTSIASGSYRHAFLVFYFSLVIHFYCCGSRQSCPQHFDSGQPYIFTALVPGSLAYPLLCFKVVMFVLYIHCSSSSESCISSALAPIESQLPHMHIHCFSSRYSCISTVLAQISMLTLCF